VQQSTKILKWQFKNDVYNSEYFIMHKKITVRIAKCNKLKQQLSGRIKWTWQHLLTTDNINQLTIVIVGTISVWHYKTVSHILYCVGGDVKHCTIQSNWHNKAKKVLKW